MELFFIAVDEKWLDGRPVEVGCVWTDGGCDVTRSPEPDGSVVVAQG